LFLVTEFFLIAAMVALDDIPWYRDGSDAANYGPDAPARRLALKPLLARHAHAARRPPCFAWTRADRGGRLSGWRRCSPLRTPPTRWFTPPPGPAYLVLSVSNSLGAQAQLTAAAVSCTWPSSGVVLSWLP